jgi:hypothetical protein
MIQDEAAVTMGSIGAAASFSNGFETWKEKRPPFGAAA